MLSRKVKRQTWKVHSHFSCWRSTGCTQTGTNTGDFLNNVTFIHWNLNYSIRNSIFLKSHFWLYLSFPIPVATISYNSVSLVCLANLNQCVWSWFYFLHSLPYPYPFIHRFHLTGIPNLIKPYLRFPMSASAPKKIWRSIRCLTGTWILIPMLPSIQRVMRWSIQS